MDLVQFGLNVDRQDRHSGDLAINCPPRESVEQADTALYGIRFQVVRPDCTGNRTQESGTALPGGAGRTIPPAMALHHGTKQASHSHGGRMEIEPG